MRQAGGLDLATLGQRVRLERARRGLSLDALAERCGVSRSMLSAVERGAKAPTVLVLDAIATGLDTRLARLLGEERAARVVVLPTAEQHVVRDPGGWERRLLSPVVPGVEFEFMRTTLGPRVSAGTFSAHPAGAREYLAVEHGALRLTIDATPYRLARGDSIYYASDCPHAFDNPGDEPTVYYLALDLSGAAGGRAHLTADGRHGQLTSSPGANRSAKEHP